MNIHLPFFYLLQTIFLFEKIITNQPLKLLPMLNLPERTLEWQNNAAIGLQLGISCRQDFLWRGTEFEGYFFGKKKDWNSEEHLFIRWRNFAVYHSIVNTIRRLMRKISEHNQKAEVFSIQCIMWADCHRLTVEYTKLLLLGRMMFRNAKSDAYSRIFLVLNLFFQIQ